MLTLLILKSDDLNKPKILYSEIVKSPQFYFDSDGIYTPEATSFLMIGKELNILIKYLNSSTVAWFFKHYYAGGGLGEGFRYKKSFIEKVPIPNIQICENDNELIEFNISQAYGLTAEEYNYISDLI